MNKNSVQHAQAPRRTYPAAAFIQRSRGLPANVVAH
jgi:hypothetical protein